MYLDRHPIRSIQTKPYVLLIIHTNIIQAMMEAMEEMDVKSPISRSVTCEN